MFSILRPYIFSLDPEVAHDLAINSLKVNLLPKSLFEVSGEQILETKLFNTEKKITSNEIFKENKFYLLNIWASWCAPCRDEHPFLLNLGKQDNLEIIGLNYKDKTENAKKFLKELNNPYKVILSDNDGIIAIEWGAYGVPESFLIHKNKIVAKYIGPLNEELINEINLIIK